MNTKTIFHHPLTAGVLIHVLAFARVEVACAAVLKLHNAAKGGRLGNLIFKTAGTTEHLKRAAALTLQVWLIANP